MITIGANGERISYGIKHYNLDTEADLVNLPTTNEFMGCTCFVISTSKYYMLNSDREWVQITPFGKTTGSGNGGGDDGSDDDTTIPEDVVYEGGII